LGNFLKNTTLLSPDTVFYDAEFDTGAGHAKKLLEERSVPNSFRTKKYYYGEFIQQGFPDGIGAVSGDCMFDPFLSSLRLNSQGGTEDADFKPFICVVNVPELSGVQTPPLDDPDRMFIIEKLMTNGFIFKSYDYVGETPEPGQEVCVSFVNAETREDAIFEFPLKGSGNASLMQKMANSGGNQSPHSAGGKSRSAKKFYGSCGGKGGSDGEDPRKFKRKKKKPKNAGYPPGGAAVPGTPKPEPSKPPANKSKPKKPSNKQKNKELPSSKKGKKGLPKCNSRGKTIFWKPSGKSDLPQVEAFGKDALFGLDISGWNAPRKIDASVFKNNGVDFIIIKLSQGTSTSNKFIIDHMAKLKNSGILLAPYHFSAAQKSTETNFKKRAQREIDVFSREIDKHFDGKPDLVPSIDFESGHGGRRHPTPYGNTVKGHNLNVQFHLELAKILRKRYGKRPLVYTAAWARGAYFKKADSGLLAEFGSETFVWWAEYARGGNGYLTSGPIGGSKSRSFKPWSTTHIWQFSGAGQFQDFYKQGVKATFDFNAMRRSTLSKLKL
tara:strand:- start:17826 stop:19481 length:1656 start_codon:yes stop_codon:yes gene_type:complete